MTLQFFVCKIEISPSAGALPTKAYREAGAAALGGERVLAKEMNRRLHGARTDPGARA